MTKRRETELTTRRNAVDADNVRALFIAGMCTAAIAATHGVGQRRVQQLVADLRLSC